MQLPLAVPDPLSPPSVRTSYVHAPLLLQTPERETHEANLGFTITARERAWDVGRKSSAKRKKLSFSGPSRSLSAESEGGS